MAEPTATLPANAQTPLTSGQLAEALAFLSNNYQGLRQRTGNIFTWMWEALQGDFNQQRSGSQIAFDTAVSMVPGVDQICDVRDIIANCRQINKDRSDHWAWIGLALTLVGLFPTLGSLLKGVLKIFFLFLRRYGLNHVVRAVDDAMTWVITLLRRREVARYWQKLGWDRVFMELASQVRAVQSLVTLRNLLQAFDRVIALMRVLLDKVANVPGIGVSARNTIAMVMQIRAIADRYLAAALKDVQRILGAIAYRLEWEDMIQRRGVINSANVHFSGTLPDTRAVQLMRAEPPPAWLSKGEGGRFLAFTPENYRKNLKGYEDAGFPRLDDGAVASFAKGLRPDVLEGPLRLYRVVSPSSQAAASDWMAETVFREISGSKDPKTSWRRSLAVWPDWNANGQFVVYEIKAGEKLNVWRGPAAEQKRMDLDGFHLEGGCEQIKFDAAIDYKPDGSFAKDKGGRPVRSLQDHTVFHEIDQHSGALKPTDLSYAQWSVLPAYEKKKYSAVRSSINNPRIAGPFDTRWGMVDFDDQLGDLRLGIPTLPGQIINRKP